MHPKIPVTDRLRTAVERFASVPPFDRYVDPASLAIVALRGRRGPSGKRAECHFTRFSDSGESLSRDGRWRLPRITLHGREIRYVIAFVLPRFLFLPADEQARDIVHELLHIDESFSGVGSSRRHGPAYDRAVERIAERASDLDAEVPPLASVGDLVLYHRFRPFPRPFRAGDRRGRSEFDERDLEVAALRLDASHRGPPPARYLYSCRACGKLYRRMKPLTAASCGECAYGYDARFKLTPVREYEDRARTT